MKIKRDVLCYFVLVMLIGLASATLNFGGVDLEYNYEGGEFAKGSLNISFSNQENGEFTSNFEGGIDLANLLENSDYDVGSDYTCVPTNCKDDFSSSNGEIAKVVDLEDEKIIGFSLDGTNVLAENFNFDLSSDVQASCINQLTIDLFNDGEINFFNNNYIDTACGVKNYGCFENSGTSEVIITDTPYCEKITLEPAPAYRIGAKVKNSSTVSGVLKMELYNGNGVGLLAACTLPQHTQSEEEIDCIVEYSTRTQKEALVCIYTSSAAAEYKIKAETTDVCGMVGIGGAATADYEIYAQRLKYDSIDSEFNSSSFEELNPESIDLINLVNSYLNDKYSYNCENNCIIPLKISSNIAQQLTIDSVNLRYDSSLGLVVSNKVYDASKTNAKFSSDGFLEFDLEDLEIVIEGTPDETENIVFSLFFDGNKIYEDRVNVTTGFDFDVIPKFVLIGALTEFEIDRDDVISSKWDFGDGSEISSSNNKAIHKYSAGGDYKVKVTATRSDRSSSIRTFLVVVGNAKDSSRSLIDKYKERIFNVTAEVNSFPEWFADKVKSSIDLNSINNSVLNLEERYDNASSDNDYVKIINELVELNVPISIRAEKSGTLPMSAGLSVINTDYIETISGEDISDENENDLRESIAGWLERSYDANVEFESISAFYDTETDDILGKYKIKAVKKPGVEGISYLIIDYPLSQITFKEDYSARAVGSGAYIGLTETKEIEFVLPEYINVEDLGVYIAPGVSEFGALGEIGEIGKEFPWGRFVLWMSVLGVFALLIYVILQEWYKRYYESYLFKKPNQVYNLINFIYNARASGADDKTIRLKLKNSGWRGEQIRYAFRKIDGKRTGMWEIPIFKFFENKKVKEEIAKRHSGVVNQKYIHRGF